MNIPRFLVGGVGSGCGKTTVSCALMQAFQNRGLTVAAFKCGPDYIDPMFHQRVIGARSRNLDAFLCGRETVQRLFMENSADCDLSIIEGVMGFYDGIGGVSEENSSADLASLTKTPALLVLRAKGMSLSAAAVVNGFLNFRPNTIKAVILNGVTKQMLPYYQDIIETQTDCRVLGCLPDMPEASIESRHLGLVTAGEIEGLRDKLERLAAAAEECIDLDGLFALAQSAPALLKQDSAAEKSFQGLRIAVASDEAFCFTYQDSLDYLRKLGAELVYFSPLHDGGLPQGVSGLYLCGGYPELYAPCLSENWAMLLDIKRAIESGMPTIAECGGFMILHEKLEGYPMAGVFPWETRLTKKIGPFGYVTLTAKKDTLVCRAGESIPAHEFHYSESDNQGDAFEASKPLRNRKWDCVHATKTLYAGYPHIHFCGKPEAAQRFLSACETYQGRK